LGWSYPSPSGVPFPREYFKIARRLDLDRLFVLDGLGPAMDPAEAACRSKEEPP